MTPPTLTRIALPVLLLSATILPAQQQTALLPAAKDNTLYQDPAGSFSNGSGPEIFVGATSSGRLRRAVIAFDVAGAVPAGSTITGVQLTLSMNMTISGAEPVELHPLLADWGEGASNAGSPGGGGSGAAAGDATWLHTFSPNMFWSTAGGDFAATASGMTSVSGNGSYTWGSTAQMVADVQSWLDVPAGNFGWLLKTPELNAPSAKRFASREGPNAGARPVLAVTFTPPAGASVTVSGAGCPAGGSLPFTLGTAGAPALGNVNFAITLANGHASGLASLYLAFGLAPNPQVVPSTTCFIHLDIPSALQLMQSGLSPIGPLPLTSAGSLFLGIPIPNDPSLAGQSIAVQALSTGAGAATTNALVLLFG